MAAPPIGLANIVVLTDSSRAEKVKTSSETAMEGMAEVLNEPGTVAADVPDLPIEVEVKISKS